MRPTISRRDFLNGVALSVVAGGTLSPRELLAAAQLSDAAPDYYPPTLTGMRGSHEGSYEAAHALAWRGERPDRYDALDEEYDLVVVGGGISGLAAAYLYRKHAGDDARILVLDNHDDFGGHAKRNEFHAGGRMLLGFGGSINLEQDYMSPRAHGLLEEIGVDFEKLEKAVHPDYLLSNSGAPSGIHLSAEEYGRRRLVVGHWSKAWSGAEDSAGLIDDLGLSERDTRKLRELAGGERDFLEGLSSEERLEYVRSTSYATFLSNRVGLSRAAARVFAPMLRALFGVGIESVSVREAVLTGVAGPNPLTGQPAGPYEPSQYPAPRYPMFPDGNASVARLFVRKLVPAIAPGSSMQDIVTARFDYSALDREDSAVRIRLNSTAVKVEHSGSDAVEVSYVTGGRAFRVRSRHCILACYNSMIPHLCPELPEAQREQLEYGSKVPFAWVNVLLRNGRSVRGSGASVFLCPGSDFGLVSVAPPVTLGDYGATDDPDGPLVVFLGNAPAPENDGRRTGRDLYRMGRRRLFDTPFSTFETQVEGQLTSMFGDFGFNADRDVEAITVNRWPHGYAYGYMDLYDPAWPAGEAPHELGRKPFGRVSIANSDAEALAYVQGAIDAAWRAVEERLKL